MYVVDNLATKEDLAISFKRNPAKQSYSFSNTTSRSLAITLPLDWRPHSLRSASILSIKCIGIGTWTFMKSFRDLSADESKVFLGD